MPIETMDELFKALNIENLDQLLESEGFSDISELILDEMDLVLIQLPDGSYEATTPYMPIGYPISQSGTYTFKVRCGGLYKEVAINVEDNHRTVFGKWKDAVITGEHMSECLLAQNEDNNIYVWTGGELSWLPPEQIIEMNEEVTILEGGVMLSKDGKRIYYLVKEDSNFELKTIEVPEGITIIDIANDYALDNNGDIWNIGTYNGTMEKEDFDYKFEKIYNNIFITKEGKIISYQGKELQGINVNSVKSISNTMLLTNEGEIYYLGSGGNLTRSMAAYEWIKKELPFKVIDIAGTMLISEDNKLYNLSDPDDIGSLTEIQLDHKPIKFIGEEETDFYRSLVNGYSIEDENGNYAEIPGDMVSDSYAWKYFEKNGNYKKVTSGRHSLALIDENNNLIIAGKLCSYPV